MKKESKVWISEIRVRLQVYARTSDQEAFEEAWYMWRAYCLRHGLHTMAFFSHTRQKGWLKRSDADQFWRYMTQEERY